MIGVPVGRLVEIASDRRHLAVHRGFLVVHDRRERKEVGRLPIDDVAAVVANAHGITCTNRVLVELATRGAPYVLCGSNHDAVGMLLPIEGHALQARRFDAQSRASLPTRKRLWADLVRAKLRHQAAVLAHFGLPSVPLAALMPRVRSGDPANVEAQGARRYWSLLFGDSFRRDRAAPGINAQLNYGYTILRSAMARAVVAAGLHPTLGLHHSNEGNAMRLVDDLMEPYRPIIDARVKQLNERGAHEVDPQTRRHLAETLYSDQPSADGITSLMACLHRLATSLAQVYLGERKTLTISELVVPPDPSASSGERP